MADKTKRVRILRTVQGETSEPDDVLVKGSVVDIKESFAAELFGSQAAESAEGEKKVDVPLHEPEGKKKKPADEPTS
jgi:hypothetical protein